MLSQSLSGVDASMRGAPYGSHGPVAPGVHGDGPIPSTPLLVQNQESAPESSPGPTLLTSTGPVVEHGKDDEMETSDTSASEVGGPREDCVYFGLDLKPMLPAALAASTVLGWLYSILFQIPWLSRFTSLSQVTLSIAISALHVLVLSCMLYCSCVDPGQLKTNDIEAGLPRRAHRSWQYPSPIRRYDHYCKWLKNGIALHNHREFIILVSGLVLIAFIGVISDLGLAALIAMKGRLENEIIVAFHLSYCLGILAIDGPILKIHMTLISRNQLAQEWRKREYYVAHNTTMGDNVPVQDLDDDEFNEIFDKDAFFYDPSKNPFDQGCLSNWLTFWCKARWPSDATGEF